LPPRGWYPDPADAGRERYWDGGRWTQRLRHRVEVLPAIPVPKAAPDNPRPPAPPAVGRGEKAADRSLEVSVRWTPLAGWWSRVGAAVIDYAIETFLLAVILSLLASGFTDRLKTAYGEWIAEVLANPGAVPAIPAELQSLSNQLVYAMMGASALYGAVFLGFWGATPGQRVLRLRVVPAPPASQLEMGPGKTVPPEVGAARLGWFASVWRALAWALVMVSGQLILLAVFSVVMVLWHPRRQTLPDIAARTLVVRRPRL
jgi:uncharacterized RDD family membrane protein YckC